jgi:hypothetical protein
VLTACGSTAAPGSSGSGSGSGTKASDDSLTIQVSHGQGSAITHWTLRCQPAGGTEPDAATACKTLQGVKDPFGPTPKGQMCPMIVEGTKTAKITGTWNGKHVSVTMSDGGCWLARWGKIGQIFN